MSEERDDSVREAGPPEEAAGRGWLAQLWEQVSTLVIAVSIALAIRAFVVEPFRIPSESMLPTLLIGDHLFVNKFLYGVRIPFTDIRLPALREPRRGDVVVFTVARENALRYGRIFPVDQRPDLPREDFVKRIVGLPGDRISVRNDRVYVNGEEMKQTETDRVFFDEEGQELSVWRESLEQCNHAVLADPHARRIPQAAFTIEEGRYFMMGDNRDHSNDSRTWGTVRLQEIQGPAFILYWSWDVNGNFLQFLNPVNWWRADKRWSRIGRRVRCLPPGEEITAGVPRPARVAGEPVD